MSTTKQRQQRICPRVDLEGYTISVGYDSLDDCWSYYLPGEDLSTAGLAAKISVDHPIIDDYLSVYRSTLTVGSPGLLTDFFPTRSFLYRTDRLNKDTVRWTFYFNQKLSDERLMAVEKSIENSRRKEEQVKVKAKT
ncbi:MAG: hypothetical protein ABEK50_10345 [bacterium]